MPPRVEKKKIEDPYEQGYPIGCVIDLSCLSILSFGAHFFAG